MKRGRYTMSVRLEMDAEFYSLENYNSETVHLYWSLGNIVVAELHPYLAKWNADIYFRFPVTPAIYVIFRIIVVCKYISSVSLQITITKHLTNYDFQTNEKVTSIR